MVARQVTLIFIVANISCKLLSIWNLWFRVWSWFRGAPSRGKAFCHVFKHGEHFVFSSAIQHGKGSCQ